MSVDEQYDFKTDTQKILKIIINSLYQHKEVFLRELLSNASDALNKVRIKKLTNEEVFDADKELEIEILIDKENNTITFRDTGIGMNQDEVVTNLGTIAQSGTEEFLKALENVDNSLIGQFGVGFYSSFLVAEKVEVLTRSYESNSTGYKWVSTGEASFSVEEVEKEFRGTEIILHLKEDTKEYLEEYKIKSLVSQYSNYIEFPIKMGEDILNEQTALWRVSPKEVEDEQYDKFFNHLGQFGKYMAKIHVRVDSPHLFYSLLYIPPTKNRMFNTQDSDWGIKLYNKKILIDEKNKDILPEYFRFVVGVIDADDFDLNVSREVVQSTRVQRQMKNYLQKKIISTLEDMAKDDEEKYMEFYREYGAFLKEGIASNDKFKDRLIDLIRFNSTNKEEDGAVTLTQYVERMKPDQEQIFYLSGLDIDTVKKSPHLEYYVKEGFEVLLLGEAIDSFLMMHLNEYNEKTFFLIDQDDSVELDAPEEPTEDGEEPKKKEREGSLGKLMDKFMDTIGGKVADVKTSDRLVNAVARLVTPKGGMSSDLQRAMKIMESQGGSSLNLPMMGKVMQINPEHEIIISLNKKFEDNPDDEIIDLIILQLHDNARLVDGDVPDFNTMSQRSEKIMALSLKE